MHVVSSLIAGVAGAANGHAEIYSKGTSTRATYYSDADGTVHSTTEANLSLDANGGAVVYVNEYVDIVVKDSTGATVRSYTEMTSANMVEYRGQSFTGTDPEDADTGTGSDYPVDLQTILNLWYTNGGGAASVSGSGIDFKVTSGSTTKTLSSWMGALEGLVYNVMDYGATGDGSTDDLSAFDDAAAAATAAGGGLVFAPAGTYDISAAFDLPSDVSLIGAGPDATQVRVTTSDHTIETAANTRGPTIISNMYLRSKNGNPTGSVIAVSGAVDLVVENCYIGATQNNSTQLVDSAAADQRVVIRNCRFFIGDDTQDAIDCDLHTSGRWVIDNCTFILPATYNPTNAVIFGDLVDIRDCKFLTSACTSGTVPVYKADSTTVDATVTGCYVETSGGATVTFITLGTYVAASRFFEDGNILPGQSDTNFEPYSYTVGAQAANVVMRTRESRVYYIANDNASLLLDLRQYGVVYWRKTGATSITGFGPTTLTTENGYEGCITRVIIELDSAGPLGVASTTINDITGSNITSDGNKSIWTCITYYDQDTTAFVMQRMHEDEDF